MKMTKTMFMAFLLACAIGTGSVNGAEQKKTIRVAVSVYSRASAFVRQWISDLKQHPAVLDGRVKLYVFDSAGMHANQHMHFENITVMGHDAVIVVANDMYASRSLVDLLAGTGIPVVASCAQTSAEGLEAFIGPDDVQAGYLTAMAVADELDGRGNVVVLRGPMEQGATQLRDVGIANALENYPQIREIRSVPAYWSKAAARQVIRDLIDRNLQIDGIIAQNDEMALGAIAELKRHNVASIPVASIDGIQEAVDAVRRGELLQTLRQDSTLEAQGAMDLALRTVIGPEYMPESSAWSEELLEQWEKGAPGNYLVPWEVITATKTEEVAQK